MKQNTHGTKSGQWSARKSQKLKKDYEKSMEKKGLKPYKSSKKTESQKDLKEWGDQDWTTKSGKKSSVTGERYLPSKAIEALTDKEYIRWILNILPLYDHSLVVYGRLIGLGDNVQGDTAIAVEGQEEEQLEEVRSPDAPSIWWQIDFEHFKSTLEDEFVGG